MENRATAQPNAGLLQAALLVFLAAATGAWLVAADLFASRRRMVIMPDTIGSEEGSVRCTLRQDRDAGSIGYHRLAGRWSAVLANGPASPILRGLWIPTPTVIRAFFLSGFC
jgi:hypothetical protein